MMFKMCGWREKAHHLSPSPSLGRGTASQQTKLYNGDNQASPPGLPVGNHEASSLLKETPMSRIFKQRWYEDKEKIIMYPSIPF